MNDTLFAQEFAHELEAEFTASLKCIERFPFDKFKWKPHPKSMEFGYLALLVAEIPLWITHIIKNSQIDFATFEHIKPKTTAEMIQHFKKNVAEAKATLLQVKDGELGADFFLKANGKELFKSSKKQQVESSINHLVHHRGQLTVYMRLNDIDVPAIYGPSADDKNYAAGS